MSEKKKPEKIILFYKFVNVSDTYYCKQWQRELCEKYNLKGRIIIAVNGINGTLGGEMINLKNYIKANNLSRDFKGIEYKWSEGSSTDFPRLSVKVRDELVTLAPDEKFDVFNKGVPLRPKNWHQMLETEKDVILLDARNNYESAIGKFPGAITPNIENFRDIKPYLDKIPKDKKIMTYCTGDIRCEYLSAYMKHKGFKEVYHLDGGIAKYGEAYKDEGHWEGSLYVFDKRRKIDFSEKTKLVGNCDTCEEPTNNVVDEFSTNKQHVRCINCSK